MYVSPNLSQQIQNRKIELHAELKLCPFIRFKRVLCNLRAVSATLLHSARYSDSGETCSHAVFVRTPAQPSCAPLRRSLVRNGRMHCGPQGCHSRSQLYEHLFCMFWASNSRPQLVQVRFGFRVEFYPILM